MSGMDLFKKDVEKFNSFLLEHDIDVMRESISFDFLKSMIVFSGIVGDTSYLRGICYYLQHLARREGTSIEEIMNKGE